MKIYSSLNCDSVCVCDWEQVSLVKTLVAVNVAGWVYSGKWSLVLPCL